LPGLLNRAFEWCNRWGFFFILRLQEVVEAENFVPYVGT
jgi:hypothetical protein